MAAPTTGFEDTGDWTTLAQETAFLTQIATETDAVLSEAGRTVQDRPIHRVDLGNPSGSTVLIVCLQHGAEPASREAGLQLVRDLAYSTDPAVTAYLASHRVVVIPNVNADGLPDTRNNTNGVNLNRQWYRLQQPEALAVQAVIEDAGPAVIFDAHETGATGADWRPYPAGLPGTHPAITTQAEDWVSRAASMLSTDGYTTVWYALNFLPFSGLSTTAAAAHAVGILSETVWHHEPAKRVQIQRDLFGDLLDWHADNTTAIDAASAASLAAATASTAPIPIPTREYIAGTLTTVDVAGYQLADPLPAHLLAAHGITATSTYVSVDQPARLIVAALCDPESVESVVTATRIPRSTPVEPREPLPDGVPAGAAVTIGGRRRPIIAAKRLIGGTVQTTDLTAG